MDWKAHLVVRERRALPRPFPARAQEQVLAQALAQERERALPQVQVLAQERERALARALARERVQALARARVRAQGLLQRAFQVRRANCQGRPARTQVQRQGTPRTARR